MSDLLKNKIVPILIILASLSIFFIFKGWILDPNFDIILKPIWILALVAIGYYLLSSFDEDEDEDCEKKDEYDNYSNTVSSSYGLSVDKLNEKEKDQIEKEPREHSDSSY